MNRTLIALVLTPITIGSLALPAAAVPTAKPAPRTLTVSIYGLPTAATPKVRVKGPNGYRVTLTSSRRLSGLKPGTYRLRAKPVRTFAGKAKVHQPHRTVTVTGSKGARVTILYTTPGTS